MRSGPCSATSLLGCYASPFPSLGLSFPTCKRAAGRTAGPGRALPSLALRASPGQRPTWLAPPRLWKLDTAAWRPRFVCGRARVLSARAEWA